MIFWIPPRAAALAARLGNTNAEAALTLASLEQGYRHEQIESSFAANVFRWL
jgi:hypothetical protein